MWLIFFLGFVFQTFNLLSTMSAFENVELPMIFLGKLKGKARRERAIELLTSWSLLLVFLLTFNF